MTAFRVLIVDDQADVRMALRIVLELEGFEAIEASNGREAIAVAERERPDAILLDSVMPDGSGRDTAATLRTVVDCPIVAFSATFSSVPSWADAFLDKTDMATAPSFLRGLLRSDS